MVLGSMAPDFEYFLRGQTIRTYGHTLWGAVFFDLPLVVIVYLVGKYVVVRALEPYFPQFPRLAYSYHSRSKIGTGLVFAYSALLGIATHLVWDSFTHRSGEVVTHWPALSETVGLFGYELPLYNLLQHASTAVGLVAIIWFLLRRYLRHEKVRLDRAAMRHKVIFWVVSAALALVILLVWFLLSRVSLAYPITWLVRSMDSVLLSLLLLALVLTASRLVGGKTGSTGA